MSYCHNELTLKAAKPCTIVLPCGKYDYLRLQMGLCNRSDIFQEKMSDFMVELEFTRAYTMDLLVVSKQNFETHIQHLVQVFTRLAEAGLKIDASKSSFCCNEL
jgi:hypothetical protein